MNCISWEVEVLGSRSCQSKELRVLCEILYVHFRNLYKGEK